MRFSPLTKLCFAVAMIVAPIQANQAQPSGWSQSYANSVSAGIMYTGCEDVLKNVGTYESGFCMGTVIAVRMALDVVPPSMKLVCMPPDLRNDVIVANMLLMIKRAPLEDTTIPLASVASKTMFKLWPCKGQHA